MRDLLYHRAINLDILAANTLDFCGQNIRCVPSSFREHGPAYFVGSGALFFEALRALLVDGPRGGALFNREGPFMGVDQHRKKPLTEIPQHRPRRSPGTTCPPISFAAPIQACWASLSTATPRQRRLLSSMVVALPSPATSEASRRSTRLPSTHSTCWRGSISGGCPSQTRIPLLEEPRQSRGELPVWENLVERRQLAGSCCTHSLVTSFFVAWMTATRWSAPTAREPGCGGRPRSCRTWRRRRKPAPVRNAHSTALYLPREKGSFLTHSLSVHRCRTRAPPPRPARSTQAGRNSISARSCTAAGDCDGGVQPRTPLTRTGCRGGSGSAGATFRPKHSASTPS